MDVIIFGTMGEIAPAIRDCLYSHGVQSTIVGFPQNLFRDEPGYRRELGKAVCALQPSALIPVGSALALARILSDRSQTILPPYVRALAQNPSTVELLESKVRCSRLADRLGIPQPAIFTSLSDAHGDCVFKRDKSFGGSGVYRPRTKEALENLAGHFRRESFLVQEYIEGDDISVDCLRKNGIFYSRSYISLGKKQGQGPSEERRIVDCPPASEYALRMLSYLDYNGVAGFDFRMDRNGNLFFLECNPRFTGGISTQISSGFDIPGLYCKLFLEDMF